MSARIPTSHVLRALLDEATAERVSLGWLMDRLGERSFGIILLLLAFLALIPGVSPVAGALLTIPAYQMIRAHAVRRQGFRDNGLGKLREVLAHRVGAVMRPAAGAASGG